MVPVQVVLALSPTSKKHFSELRMDRGLWYSCGQETVPDVKCLPSQGWCTSSTDVNRLGTRAVADPDQIKVN
jgi:hypothetical protein